MTPQQITHTTLKRLPLYLNFLRSFSKNCPVYISATTIAEQLGLNHVQVRKDLAAISEGGRPKTGYATAELIRDLEKVLCDHECRLAVLVGVGHLGRALLFYDGFSSYGLEIVAAFDSNSLLVGQSIHGKEIFSSERIAEVCHTCGAQIGIIAVPVESAQQVCDQLVESGVRAIWNFAPVHLAVPKSVLLHNENLAVSLGALARELSIAAAEDAAQKGQ